MSSSPATVPGSPAATSSPPNPTPSFSFSNIPLAITCNAFPINWTYSGSPEDVSFSISTDLRPITDLPGLVKRYSNYSIVSGIDATIQTWIWPTVNLTAGNYLLGAEGASIQASTPLFIVNGEDTSCLVGASPSPSSISSSPELASTSSTSTSSAGSASSAAPVVGATSNHARSGAIAGGVVGGVIIVAAAIAAYIYFGLCRRTPTRSRRRALDGQAPLGKWGGLSSRDSGMDAPMGNKPSALAMVIPSHNKRATVESQGTILSPLSSTAHGHQYPSRRASEEEATLAGVEEVKAVTYGKGYEYVESVPPLAYNSRRRSSASTSGATSPTVSIPDPIPSAGSMGRSRARSSSQSHRALALAKLDGNDPVPPPHTRSPGVPQRSIDAPPMAMSTSPPYDYIPSPVSRASSGGGGQTPRRTARKPVPALDASDLPSPSPITPITPGGASVSRKHSLASTITAANSPPPSAGPHGMYRNESQSSTTLRVQPLATGRKHSREDLEAAGLELPNLNHKSSFGDKPVHYLIPDMPPPSMGG